MKIAGNGGSEGSTVCCGQDEAYVEVLRGNEWKQEKNKEIVDEKEGETLPSANVSTSPGASGGDNV